MDRSPQTSPGQAGTQQPIRPPYLDEDPWTSSTPKDTSHWTRVRQLLNKYDRDTIGNWQEEINNQLIVSTLLSALTGAFVIETQKNLSEDPIITAAVLLSHIAMQLNASIALPPTTLQPFSNPPPNARAVNSLLYVSLGLSLSNVTVGLLCLQWLRELKSDTPGIPDRRYPYVHLMRHTGFQKWGAKGLVSALPLLLLSSLTCFFAALLLHISTTDWVVVLPVGVVLGVTFGVLVLTTLVPAVVVAGCAAFHRGALVGGYPPIPPFQSLQSWISLQLAITILRSPIFKKLISFPGLLRTLKCCPDWSRICFHWQYRAASGDPLFLPLIHSSTNPSRLDDVALCFFDTQALKQFPEGNPIQMKTQTLCYFIERYSKELPPATLQGLYTKLAIQLVHYFNDDGDFADLGHPAIKFAMDIDTLPIDVRTQLLHAVVQSHERKHPVDTFSWDFFWLVIRLYINASGHLTPSPMLVIRALDVVAEFGKRQSNAEMAMTFQYRLFVHMFSRLLTSYRPHTTTDHWLRAAASVLFHPVWNGLVLGTRAPAAGTPTWGLEALDNLESMKNKLALHDYAPLSFDWTAQLYPDSEPVRPHTSIDMDTVDLAAEAKVEEIPLHTNTEPGRPHISVNMDLAKYKIEEFPPSPVPLPVELEDLAVDRLPPIVPALSPMDLVERGGEEAMDGVIILNIGETEHRIPTSGSSPVPALEHTEMEYDRHASRDREKEDDLSASDKRLTSTSRNPRSKDD